MTSPNFTPNPAPHATPLQTARLTATGVMFDTVVQLDGVAARTTIDDPARGAGDSREPGAAFATTGDIGITIDLSEPAAVIARQVVADGLAFTADVNWVTGRDAYVILHAAGVQLHAGACDVLVNVLP